MVSKPATVDVVTQVTDELLDAFVRLLPQLSKTAKPLTAEALRAVLGAPSNIVLVARAADDNRIVGTLTLVVMHIATGTRAWIEDVVVDADARGLGVGEALVSAAIAHARQQKARTIDLTSNQSRVAARRLYERMGFSVRDTSVYRLTIQSPDGGS